MTANTPTPDLPENQEYYEAYHTLSKVPGLKWLKDLNIGSKLTIGFAILVILTLLVIALSTLASQGAVRTLHDTDEFRFPTSLAAFQAQANLLRMQTGVRGYLALGDEAFRDGYEEARFDFEENLAELRALKPHMTESNQARLEELEFNYTEWSVWPEQLFALRADRLEREPAYQVLAIEGVALGGQALLDLRTLIEAQALREPNSDNMALLVDMANFQVSFAAMLSGLRNYVATQNDIFRLEYEANFVLNDIAWETLQEKGERGLLTENQLDLLDKIEENRDEFLDLPDVAIFPILEGDQFRRDLYLFATEAEPVAELMIDLLLDITEDEHLLLEKDLGRGTDDLSAARGQTLVGGVAAVILGLGLAVILRANIVGPVTRLTDVSERVRQGNLEAKAYVESGDEIGKLALTFNNMTSRLRDTLFHVRRERKRANDLLNVVIPIGVELSSEKDFNRLLEKMLLEAKRFCKADAGSLYLIQDEALQFAIVRNDSLDMVLGGTTGKAVSFKEIPLYQEAGQPDYDTVAAKVALTGETVNITNAYESDYDFPGTQEFDSLTGYHTRSMLTIPLKDSENKVLGVLQLLNACDADTGEVTVFDANLQQMMESFSSLAVAALAAYMREQALRQEIRQLRIEIDETKVQAQVSQTIETDFFQDLQGKAREIRQRRRQTREAMQEKADDTVSGE